MLSPLTVRLFCKTVIEIVSVAESYARLLGSNETESVCVPADNRVPSAGV